MKISQSISNYRISGISIKGWLFLAIITAIGFWPISSDLFSLKNDAFIYFLPCRYFISDSIQQGHFPFWNPYFYMGFPLHGDMQGGVWNPIVLFISLFTRYNMTVLQYETLLYIFLAGIGLVKLLTEFNISGKTKYTMAAAFMLCGFITDTGQITVWTGSAAFLPFVFLYYYRILTGSDNRYGNAIKLAMAMYFFLTAGYPSFLIFCVYIMLAGIFAKYIPFLKNIKLHQKNLTKLIGTFTLAMLIFILIALPALISYLDFFPYYKRSGGISIADAQKNPFDPFAIISYLFPLSVTKSHEWISTDPTARNAFVGIFTLIFFAAVFRKKLLPIQKFVFVVLIITFLFSVGNATPLREFFYNYLPGMNLFRHPGTMRLFTTLGLIFMAAFGLERIRETVDRNTTMFFKLSSTILAIITIILILINIKGASIFGKLSSFSSSFTQAGDKRSFLKLAYDSLSFGDAIVLQGIIQLLFLGIFYIIISGKINQRMNWIAALSIANCLLLAQFSIPATFVTRKSPGEINSFIGSAPKDYPIPAMNETLEINTNKENASEKKYGYASFYTKKVALLEDQLNPSFMLSQAEFLNSTIIKERLSKYPIAYFADTIINYRDSLTALSADDNKKIIFMENFRVIPVLPPLINTIEAKEFNPWKIAFNVERDQAGEFALFQNYHHNWQLNIDGKPTPINKSNLSFIHASIPAGKHELIFNYASTKVKIGMYVAVLSLLLCIMHLLYWKWNSVKSGRIE